MGAYRMYCGRCTSLVGEQSRFCEQCGLDLSGRTAPRFTVKFGNVVIHQGLEPAQILGVFGDHLLVREIGVGGMGQVFETMHRVSGQRFALKLVRERLRLKGSRHLDNLVKEAQMQAQIVHPNVVRGFGLLEHQGQLGLLLELIRGESLDVLLDRGESARWHVKQAMVVAQQMAIGLDVVHHHGFIHADVKPANFMLGDDARYGRVLKVSDFGIARSLRSNINEKVANARTPGYSSPEQIRGESLTAVSDLYALGCVIYELMAGQPVFPYDDVNRCDNFHLTTAAPPIWDYKPDTPKPVGDLIHRLMAKEPRERPRSAREVYDELTRCTG